MPCERKVEEAVWYTIDSQFSYRSLKGVVISQSFADEVPPRLGPFQGQTVNSGDGRTPQAAHLPTPAQHPSFILLVDALKGWPLACRLVKTTVPLNCSMFCPAYGKGSLHPKKWLMSPCQVPSGVWAPGTCQESIAWQCPFASGASAMGGSPLSKSILGFR